MVTASTVGYGDILPTTDLGKIFVVIYAPVGAVALGFAVQTIASLPVLYRHERLKEHVLQQFGDAMNEVDFAELKRSIHIKAE